MPCESLHVVDDDDDADDDDDDDDDETQGLGRGSFGQVVKARDHKDKVDVALKIIRNEKRFHRQAQEEIRILEHLRKQDVNNRNNVVHMLETFTFRNHICITFELLSINLYEVAIASRIVSSFIFCILGRPHGRPIGLLP